MLPGWFAVMVVVPEPTMVTMLPEIVATDVLLLLYVRGKPDEEVADKAKGASPKVLLDNEVNVMVWAAFITLIETCFVEDL